MRFIGSEISKIIYKQELEKYNLLSYANPKTVFSICEQTNLMTIGTVKMGICIELERFFILEKRNKKYLILKEVTSNEYVNTKK